MPKYQELVILIVIDRQMDKTNHFTLCACARGNEAMGI